MFSDVLGVDEFYYNDILRTVNELSFNLNNYENTIGSLIHLISHKQLYINIC